jgi:hypothetical protein
MNVWMGVCVYKEARRMVDDEGPLYMPEFDKTPRRDKELFAYEFSPGSNVRS